MPRWSRSTPASTCSATIWPSSTATPARSECYLQAQHVRLGTPGGDTTIVAGTYADRLQRQPDGWKITHRRLTVTWTDGNSAVLGA